jgi:glutaredoxin 3
MAHVTIYTTITCPYCIRAKQLLKQKNVQEQDITEIDVSHDAELRSSMVAKAGGRKTVPQIFIGDTHVGGFDDMALLDREGKLDALLAG